MGKRIITTLFGSISMMLLSTASSAIASGVEINTVFQPVELLAPKLLADWETETKHTIFSWTQPLPNRVKLVLCAFYPLREFGEGQVAGTEDDPRYLYVLSPEDSFGEVSLQQEVDVHCSFVANEQEIKPLLDYSLEPLTIEGEALVQVSSGEPRSVPSRYGWHPKNWPGIKELRTFSARRRNRGDSQNPDIAETISQLAQGGGRTARRSR